MVELEPNVDETLKLVVELVQTTCTLAMEYMEAQRNNQSRQPVDRFMLQGKFCHQEIAE